MPWYVKLSHRAPSVCSAVSSSIRYPAWRSSPEKVTVNTCTLDHPAALPFYRKAGFVPWKRQIEVADDPRLCGIASPQAAPHIPLIAAADER